jgi:lipopolysaccharide export system permease protein
MIATINLYLAKRYAHNLFMVLLLIAGIIFIFDTMEMFRVASENKVSLRFVIKMALMKNYGHVHATIPFVIFLATILTFSQFSVSNQLIAMQVSGISIRQLLMPVISVAVLFGIFNMVVLNPVGSHLLARFEHLEAVKLKGRASSVALSDSGLWFRQKELRGNDIYIVHSLRVSPKTQEIFDVIITKLDKEGGFIQSYRANKGVVGDNLITLTDANIQDRYFNNFVLDETRIEMDISFEQIQEGIIPPSIIPFWRLPSFIMELRESGFSVVKHINHFLKMLISPLFYAAMVVLAFTFASYIPRHNRGGMLVTSGFLVGFVIYFLADIIGALGLSGAVPLWLSVPAPTIICFATGAYLILQREFT